MSSPPFLKVVPQHTEADCGVACLATLLNLPYEDVYLEVAKVDKRRSRRGLWMTQIKKAAALLGHQLIYKRKWDPDETTGILGITFDETGPDHVVVLWNGIIIDTNGTLYEYDAYMALNKARPLSLLALK